MTEISDAFRSRFEFKKELGKGGMGEVYLAYDAFSQRDVAIKLAKLAMLEDPEVGPRVKKMWLNETRLAGKLRHPCIVELYEAGVAEDFGYLVMEYVEGGTLRPHTRPGSLLPVETVIEVVYKVCNALEYATTLGLLHRDIKPANVMYAGGGNVVKVMDFGTAYFTQSDETQVFDVGTLPYMPPEHFKKRSPTVQSDIYAVGVMAYQLLAGALPFNANSFQEMIHEKLHESFVPLETRRKDLANEVRFAVHRAIHPEPEIRYNSWQAFCDDLAHALPQINRSREVAFESARFDLLSKLPFFSGFADAQLWEAIHISEWRDVPEATVIFEEGAPGGSIYVIARGDAVVARGGVTLNRMGPGECFGELAYLDEEKPLRSATVKSRTPLVLIEIEAEALRQASEALQAAFHRAFMKLMVKRIKHADKRTLDVLTPTPSLPLIEGGGGR